MTARIACIVEGHGEVESLPILVRRIALVVDPGYVPKVLPPHRIPASKLRSEGELERAVDLAARRTGRTGGVVVLLDADWEGCCPATDGPELLGRAREARADVPLVVVLAKMEYEAWFLAAAESSRGCRGLPDDLTSPAEPDEIRDAKGWLARKMKSRFKYAETTDQPSLTARFDMESARLRSRSFRKCYGDVRSMLEELRDS